MITGGAAARRAARVLNTAAGAVAPLIVVAVGLVAGDGAAIARPASPCMVGMIVLPAALVLATRATAGRRAAWFAVAFALGYARADDVYRPMLSPDHIAALVRRDPIALEGELLGDAEPRDGGGRLCVAVRRADVGDGWRPSQGSVLLTVRQMEIAWHVGDRLRVRVTVRRPRNFGNPGEFNYEQYLARRGIYATAFAADDRRFERLPQAPNGIGAMWWRWRRGVTVLFQRALPEPQASILGMLIVGLAPALPVAVREAFSRAGVTHVLSISGLHVGLVAAAGYVVFRWLLARSHRLLLTINVPKVAAALSVLPVLLYAGIAGSNVATLRSLLMILVFLGAAVVDRERQLVMGLAAAAAVIVIASPGSAGDISFQLSFAAVLGLTLAMERFRPWWRAWEEVRLVRLRGWRARLWRPVALYIVVAVSALATTLPLTAFHFNQVSLMALIANAVVVPLLGSAAVSLGLMAALAYPLSPPLATAFTAAAGPFVTAGYKMVEVLAAVPYAAVRVVTPTAFELGIIYAGLYGAARMSGRRRRLFLAGVAIVAAADGGCWYLDRYHRSDLRITFLSVGEGDSAVVELPGAAVMVIDGGGLGSDTFDVGERIVAPFLWSRKIARVDYLVMSHPDRDHYGGLAFLAANFRAREFWSTGDTATSARFGQLLQGVADSGAVPMVLRRGAQRQIGLVSIEVHAPEIDPAGVSDNDRSLVLSLRLAGTRVLFTGDIEAPAELHLVASGDDLRSAVLKVPHHGSKTSSTPAFLRAVRPQLAVVSAGYANHFGFPHPQVLQRYANVAACVARTDAQGAVAVRIDRGGSLDFLCHKPPE